MTKPEITVKLDADGRIREGEVHPDLGATVEIRFEDSTRCKIGIDYRDPDSLKVTLAGDFSLRAVGARNVRVGGTLERSLFDGQNRFHGSLRWKIPNTASVEITADHADEEDRVGAKVTLRF